jgi:hypothetical protein
MVMGSSLSPIISNIFMEHFEQLALDSAPQKRAMWLRYVDDTFVVWPHVVEKVQEFVFHILTALDLPYNSPWKQTKKQETRLPALMFWYKAMEQPY